MQEFIRPLTDLGTKMTAFTTEIGFKAFSNANEVGAASVDYLRVAGHLVFGYFFARMAQISLKAITSGNAGGDTKFYQGKIQTARFYFAKLFPETLSLMATARSGSACLMETEEVLV
jgi:Acetyl-CoA dehydrogenase C-terminal like